MELLITEPLLEADCFKDAERIHNMNVLTMVPGHRRAPLALLDDRIMQE
jgi:hypothetical protein